MIGACVFAYGLTNVCSLLFNHNKTKVEFEALTDEMSDWLLTHRVSGPLSKQVHAYLWYVHYSSRVIHNQEKTDQLMSRLTPELRDKVMHNLMLQIFRRHPVQTVWSSFSDEFLVELARSMVAQAFAPGEHLVGGTLSTYERARAMSARRVHLIVKGACQVRVAFTETVYELGFGCSLGELSVLFGKSLESMKVITRGYCDVYSICNTALTPLLELYPVVHGCLRQIFCSRKYDFVLMDELAPMNDQMVQYMQEKASTRATTEQLRALEVDHSERVSMLSTLTSPRSRRSHVHGNHRDPASLELQILEAEEHLNRLKAAAAEARADVPMS